MKRAGVAALVLAAVVAVAVLIGWRVWKMYEATYTGDPALDRFRGVVAREVARVFGVQASPAVARAVMAIIRNESGGRPAPVIGDETLPGGPSVGPMQVYRATARDLGLWAPPPDATTDADERDAFGSFANDEATCIGWGVRVLKAKVAAAHGDLADAVRRYNGAGQAAAAYRDRAVTWAEATWGEGALS